MTLEDNELMNLVLSAEADHSKDKNAKILLESYLKVICRLRDEAKEMLQDPDADEPLKESLEIELKGLEGMMRHIEFAMSCPNIKESDVASAKLEICNRVRQVDALKKQLKILKKKKHGSEEEKK